MSGIFDYLPLGGQYSSVTALCQNPKNTIYLASSESGSESALVCFFTVSPQIYQDQIKMAARHYVSLSKRLKLVPIQEFLLFCLPDGGHDVAVVFPALTPLAVENTGLTPDQKLSLVLEIGQTVSSLYKHGYAPGSLAPGNITVDRGDSALFEFCLLGSVFDKLMSRYISKNPDFIPTAYTPPEVSGGGVAPDEIGDVFSLGRIAYALFNRGVLPDRLDNPPLPKDAPKWLAEMILRACQPDPFLRWDSMQQFCSALRTRGVMPDERDAKRKEAAAAYQEPTVIESKSEPNPPKAVEPTPPPNPEVTPEPESKQATEPKTEPEVKPKKTKPPAKPAEPSKWDTEISDRLTPEEMAELYPTLTHYFSVFDPKKSKTFAPPPIHASQESAQLVEKRKGIPWALLAAAAVAAAVILYIVINQVLNMPAIG